MHMNTRATLTAATLLNDSTEETLADIFHLYGELRQAHGLAGIFRLDGGRVSEDLTGRSQELLALARDGDAPRGARENGNPELLLKGPDCFSQRRLRDEHAARRFTQAAATGDGIGVLELLERHANSHVER